jgi:hypothetical protein
MYFSTYDYDNSNFMIYGCVYDLRLLRDNSEETPDEAQIITYFICIVKHTDNGVELITMIPTNPYKCKDELVEFKESNNWK